MAFSIWKCIVLTITCHVGCCTYLYSWRPYGYLFVRRDNVIIAFFQSLSSRMSRPVGLLLALLDCVSRANAAVRASVLRLSVHPWNAFSQKPSGINAKYFGKELFTLIMPIPFSAFPTFGFLSLLDCVLQCSFNGPPPLQFQPNLMTKYAVIDGNGGIRAVTCLSDLPNIYVFFVVVVVGILFFGTLKF